MVTSCHVELKDPAVCFLFNSAHTKLMIQIDDVFGVIEAGDDNSAPMLTHVQT